MTSLFHIAREVALHFWRRLRLRAALPGRVPSWLVALAVGLPFGAVPDAPAVDPFETELQAFASADAALPPPPDPVVFVGSSTFARWTDLPKAFPGFNVLNRGFGGSQFGDVLRLFDRVVARYAPSLIVVYEGDNDLAGGRTVDQVFSDWTNFVARVRRELPGTGVLFVGVKPSPSRRTLLPAQQALNARIAADASLRPGCWTLDVAGPMLDTRGEPIASLYAADQLHLSDQGYTLWRSLIAPELESWAAAQPERSIRSPAGSVLVDFGAADLVSGGESSTNGPLHWNNITASIGTSSQARLDRLVTARGEPTDLAWVMSSRFNGVNQNGTTAAAPFPSSATSDSLFGNTETFGGLDHVTPAFRLAGLRLDVSYALTFYASRTGVSDNRETRYEVTGATTASTDLNVANNVTATTRIDGVEAAADGTLRVALLPGPRNNNANHFVYLGVLVLEEAIPGGRVFLFDVGGADSPTGVIAGPPVVRWNDLTARSGVESAGVLTNLWTTEGVPTAIALQVVSPFAAVDTGGTLASSVYPASASRDGLVGYGRAPGSLEARAPAFRWTGLDSNQVYRLGFYASRTGAVERSETRYIAQGGNGTLEASLEPRANTNLTAWVGPIHPDPAGEILVQLEPGPANQSPALASYLGVGRLDWWTRESVPHPTLTLREAARDRLRLVVRTARGRSCRLEWSADLRTWQVAGVQRPGDAGNEVEWPVEGGAGFLRLVDLP